MNIEIVRPKQNHDKRRDYQLFVDGNIIDTLKPNSKITIEISDKAEYIEAKIDWCRSQRFYIKDITSGKIEVRNSMDNKGLLSFLLPLYYISFGKNKYLTIENCKY